jgi:zinc protease
MIALVVAAVACGSPRSQVRFGSLVASRRSLDYDPGIGWWKLPNQLTVAVMPDSQVNLVSVDVRYLVGAAEDPPGKTGLAHLVEHVMFSRRVKPGGPTIADRLSAAGLRYNAFTTADSTHYIALGLAGRLDELLAIEATRMAIGCAGLDEATLAHERAVVLQEIAQRGTVDLVEQLQGATFGPGHAYSHSVGGRDVATLTLDDVCRFIDAHYAPARAILVIGGRIPKAAVHDITTRFGAIARRATGARAVVQPVAWTGKVSDLSVDVDDPSVLVMFPAAPWGSREWIYDNLVDRIILQRLRQVAYREHWILGVSSRQLGGMRGGARAFELRLSDARRADDAAAKVYAAIRDLPGRYDDDLVLTLGSARQSELFDAFESIGTRGGWCADFLQFTTDGKFQMRELAELQHLDLAMLRARADRLDRDASRVVRLTPTQPHAHASRAGLTASADIDMPVWRATVDPAEADRPLALPRDPRASSLAERRLPNGLRVMMLPDFKQPVFEARLVFPVGETATGGGKRGAAIATAGVLSYDVDTWFTPKQREIVSWVFRIGAPVTWSVTDHTTFRIHGFSLFADGHLWRLHWLLANGRYQREDVQHMQEVVARDAAHRDRHRVGRRALREALFGKDHPYAQDSWAALASNAGALSVPDLERFRDGYYRANGATLILVGNFDPEAMMKRVTELFGAWPSEPSPALEPVPPMHPARGPIWIAAADPEAVQVRISYAFAATSPRASRGTRRVIAEMIRDRVEQVRSRLGASYGIDVRYDLGEAGDVLEVDGLVNAERAGEAVRQLAADLEGLRAGDAALAADFVRARRAALLRALGDPGRSTTAADRLEAVAANHLPIDAVDALPAEIAATTLGAARAVIAQDLRAERMVVMLGGRPKDTAAAFAAAGVTTFQTVTEEPGAAPAPQAPAARQR